MRILLNVNKNQLKLPCWDGRLFSSATMAKGLVGSIWPTATEFPSFGGVSKQIRSEARANGLVEGGGMDDGEGTEEVGTERAEKHLEKDKRRILGKN